MNGKRIVKGLVALVVLAAVTAAFFGAPTDLACRIQPAASVVFLVVLLLTPLCGRLFCECLCPLGILQSVVNRLFHPRTAVRRVCTRLPERPVQRIVRYAALTAVAALIATGFGALGWLLTPYSIYGKALTLFVPGVVLFALVLVLAAIGKGRFWCNWICPVGTLFTLLSKKSVCAHKVGPGCSHCQACFPKKAVSAEPPEAGGAADLTRRETLQGMAVLAAVETVDKTTDGGYAAVSLPGVPTRETPVLPPGAVDRAAFNVKCVACGLCIKACRGGCLTASTSLKRFGQPEMDFRKGYCLTGCNYACGHVCPTGAINWIPRLPRKNVHVGRAVWRKDLCIRTTDGVACTACSKKCPVKAIHIVEGFPVVDRDTCIGCGACEHVCPSRPEPAVRVEGYDRPRIVWPMQKDDAQA